MGLVLVGILSIGILHKLPSKYTYITSAVTNTSHDTPILSRETKKEILPLSISTTSDVPIKVISESPKKDGAQDVQSPLPQTDIQSEGSTNLADGTVDNTDEDGILPKNELRKLSWGVFTGSNIPEIKEFEEKVSASPDYLAYFVSWGNHEGAFPHYLAPYTKDKGRTLVIFWEAGDYTNPSTEQSIYSYPSILAGNWNYYIASFAREALAYGAPIILIPFSEMNGDWNSWSGTTNGNTVEEAVLAYRQVRDVFRNVPNVKFGWAPNVHSSPNTEANQFEKYYPGDDFVDYVGVDGFNFLDRWDTFSSIFDDSLLRLTKYNKPIYLFSFASAESTKKAEWMQDAFSQMQKYPLLSGWIWFNQDKEHNWLVWSDDASFEVFKQTIESYQD
jgi:hypothetical protein